VFRRFNCICIKTYRVSSTTFFTYTTLFRSSFKKSEITGDVTVNAGGQKYGGKFSTQYDTNKAAGSLSANFPTGEGAKRAGSFVRSEEHTSELQSQSNLVCRLLLEKKK